MNTRTACFAVTAFVMAVGYLGISLVVEGDPSTQDLVWEQTGGPLGGLGYDIRFNFTHTNEWYVTDAYAGFHMSIDNGLTWLPSNSGIDTRILGDVIPIFCATVDPHNTEIIWIGTQLSGDIFKSTDRGRTWVKKNNGLESDPARKPWYSFRGFTVDPQISDIVYAMAEIGSPGWTPDGSELKGIEQDMTKGVVYKTTDGGDQWQEIWRGDNLTRYCWIDPTHPDTLYVSTGIFDREAANSDKSAGFAGGVGILKSTDGGQSWTVLNQANGLMDLYVGSLFMHPTNPNILLAAASENNWSGYDPNNFTGGVYRTQDGGSHWSRVTSEKELFSSVEFSLSNPMIAYAGSRQAVYRSSDGGITWQRFGRPDGTWGSPGVIAGFPIDMQCDPINPTRIFINNYLGGNFLSHNGGETWASVSQGYTGAQVRAIAVVNSDEVYAGGRSGIFRTPDAGDTWIGLSNPGSNFSGAAMNEIQALAAHPKRPEWVVASGSDVAGVIWTDNAGQLWNRATGINKSPQELFSDPSQRSRFYAVGTPYNAVRRVLGTPNPDDGIHVSQDSGRTWTLLSSDTTGVVITTFAVDPRDSNVLYAAKISALKNGTVSLLKSTDGGVQWTAVGAGLPANIPIASMAINPANASIVFAGLDGGAVYRSTDGGLSFAPAVAGLDAQGTITSINIHPKWAANPTKSRILVGDYFSGVFISEDGGITWRPLNEGLDHKSVNSLKISPEGSMVYAAIEGAGVYRMKWR